MVSQHPDKDGRAHKPQPNNEQAAGMESFIDGVQNGIIDELIHRKNGERDQSNAVGRDIPRPGLPSLEPNQRFRWVLWTEQKTFPSVHNSAPEQPLLLPTGNRSLILQKSNIS